jgi:hypothetical protein
MERTKTATSLETLENKLGEIAEECKVMERLAHKLARSKRGSEAYFELLAEIAVSGSVLSAKLQSLDSMIEDVEDAMPDDD